MATTTCGTPAAAPMTPITPGQAGIRGAAGIPGPAVTRGAALTPGPAGIPGAAVTPGPALTPGAAPARKHPPYHNFLHPLPND